ncbi:MAG: N-acetylglutaminylglutamine amidotransferase [Gammaproteobacteria bacterium]|nr:MAG: N-acetylglutaminylglutamine amidotransferase [Gammaproteobacteria bacterium]
MCGICGELRIDGARPDRDLIIKMNRVLAHRGPDDEGFYEAGPVAFGHRRLAIIDLSSLAHQPMVDEPLGLAIVFNGTIYNYKSLRTRLQGMGHEFMSSGDTEVILKAYAEWGEDCIYQLTGMFAFVLWDQHRQTLFMARDRVGIKPLYYASVSGGIRFASSMQSLLSGGDIDTTFDPVALHYQFSLHGVVPAPHTIFKGIRKLMPAHTLTVSLNGEQSLRRYWSLKAARPNSIRSDGEWLEETHVLLKQAVKRRMLASDVPVGVLLSGGLDSSLLVALLAEQGQKSLLTFSVGFEDQPEEKGSEFEYSDQVVAQYNTHHHKILIPNDEVIKRLPEAVSEMTEPMFGQDAVAFYLLAEQVSRHVKVVQSGQGADEVFAGYFWYQHMADASGDVLERFAPHYFDRDHAEITRMINPALVDQDYTSAFIESQLTKSNADTYIDQVLRLDAATLVVDDPVKRVDNMTMAWGLEARVPFLDHDLVEWAASMPPHLKLASGGKHALKQIARGLLPDAVIDRPKGYFPVPALKFVRGDVLKFMREILLSETCRSRGLYQQPYVERLLAEPEAHFTPIKGSKLWHLAVFELWLQRNLTGF